jgi:ABC-type multidrug transport system ATPase subunit
MSRYPLYHCVYGGEVFGFLGPNGAGKTTAIKMLLGLVTPTSGDATLLGAPLGDRSVRARVGLLPEHFRFHDCLTARELLGISAASLSATRQRPCWLHTPRGSHH